MAVIFKIAILSILIIATQAWKDKKPDVTRIDGVMEYLEAFNYLAPIEDGDGRAAQSGHSVQKAISDFQQFVGVKVTGDMTPETVEWMLKPRCAIPDKERPVIRQRRKRFVLEGSKWKPQLLSYKVLNYASGLEPQTQDFLIAKSFQMWSDFIPLEFIRKPWYENTDIDITFLSYGHGDHENFDGRGGVLAHAFYPYYGGDIHFDADELWAYQDPSNNGTDYLATFVHEIGHTLGLAHSEIKEAVMWPYIQKYSPDFRLHPDDVNGIHRIYGPRPNAPTFAPVATEASIVVETPTRKPLGVFNPRDLCYDGPINAGVTDGKNSTFIFRGNYFYEVDNYGVMDGYPMLINDTLKGFAPLNGPIDGALYLEATNELLLFKTYYYASYIDRIFQHWGIISQRFPGIPPSIDDAFVWPVNNKTYFLKGEIYWRLNESGLVDPNYPKPMRGWDMPFGADAAFVYKNQRLYLFRSANYYRFNDATYKIDYGYPRDINHWWFGCREFDRALAPPPSDGSSSSNTGTGSGSGSTSSSTASTGSTWPSFYGGNERSERNEGNERNEGSERSERSDDVNPRFRRASNNGSGRIEISLFLMFIFVAGKLLNIL